MLNRKVICMTVVTRKRSIRIGESSAANLETRKNNFFLAGVSVCGGPGKLWQSYCDTGFSIGDTIKLGLKINKRF